MRKTLKQILGYTELGRIKTLPYNLLNIGDNSSKILGVTETGEIVIGIYQP